MDKVNTGKYWISSNILQNINLDILDVESTVCQDCSCHF